MNEKGGRRRRGDHPLVGKGREGFISIDGAKITAIKEGGKKGGREKEKEKINWKRKTPRLFLIKGSPNFWFCEEGRTEEFKKSPLPRQREKRWPEANPKKKKTEVVCNGGKGDVDTKKRKRKRGTGRKSLSCDK